MLQHKIHSQFNAHYASYVMAPASYCELGLRVAVYLERTELGTIMRAINVAVQVLQELYPVAQLLHIHVHCTCRVAPEVYLSSLTVGIRCSPRSARRCAVLYYNYASRFSQYKYTCTIGYPTNSGGVS